MNRSESCLAEFHVTLVAEFREEEIQTSQL